MAGGLHQICKFTKRIIFLRKRMDLGSCSFFYITASITFHELERGIIMTQTMYSIKEAAKELEVETHALRYWEEELELSIGRNTQGRRIYTEENMQTFKRIKAWKEEGLQLKAIKQLIHQGLHSGISQPLPDMDGQEKSGRRIIMYRPKEAVDSIAEVTPATDADIEKAEKAKRLQELLKQFISESIKESNAELLQMMKEGLLKELDYQFRLQEEREAEREKVRIEMEDAHFKRLDENLRNAMEKRGRRKKKRGF